MKDLSQFQTASGIAFENANKKPDLTELVNMIHNKVLCFSYCNQVYPDLKHKMECKLVQKAKRDEAKKIKNLKPTKRKPKRGRKRRGRQ
jgi:hypothetical protein